MQYLVFTRQVLVELLEKRVLSNAKMDAISITGNDQVVANSSRTGNKCRFTASTVNLYNTAITPFTLRQVDILLVC